MKNQKRNGNGKGPGRVRIEFNHPTAAVVALAGTFNDWHPSATAMVPLGNGRWVKELTLPPGTYEYRLVVDGAWMCDPAARESKPNPFGELNSVLTVNGHAESPRAPLRNEGRKGL